MQTRMLLDAKAPVQMLRPYQELMVQEQVRVNLRGLAVALVVVVALVIFGGGALANSDPLWFYNSFDETPQRIVFHRAGCQADLVPGDPGFAELTQAINEALPQYEGYSAQFGMSQDSGTEYRARETYVEVIYSRPVTIHTPYRFGHPDQLFIPLTGYFSDERAIFGGHAGDYWSGALRLKSLEPIQKASQGIACSQ